MAKDVHPPRGMRDFLPVEKQKRDIVLNNIRSTYLSHGFQEIETPALEDLERLTSGQGGDNEKLAFRVMKRGEELERAIEANTERSSDNLADLGLRFDLTVPLTRYYATNRSKLPKVFKAIQAGPVWRAERPQKGRYRQFIQCDIDIIGESSILAEIDLLTSSLHALEVIGLTDATIRLNHRLLLAKVLADLGIPEDGKPAAMIIIDKLDKIFAEGVVKELGEKFGDKVAEAAKNWLPLLNSDFDVPSELQEIFSAIETRFGQGRLRFDPTLVRGMGYYTGTIFEIEHPDSGSSIGGGGRYDGMIGRWTGDDVPAVGISIGFERAVDLVPDSFVSKPPMRLVLVLENDSPAVIAAALNLQPALFEKGYAVRLELRPKKLNILLDSLAEQGFTHFAAIGEDPVNMDALVIKPIGN
ncbi:MAG: histidine--tRNA ligase [Actinobacteria bacterium]|uniref:histidine--tRNA ligase n=1 Tax=freshwater metagenome TaxID=449393 RepID=A0A6J6IJG2_9ZZZZ|nr:histidine--tRNA ligase [Actinomycetota bacterium]